MARNPLFKVGRVVWCGAVGYGSGLRDVDRDNAGGYSMWHVTICLKLVVWYGVGL